MSMNLQVSPRRALAPALSFALLASVLASPALADPMTVTDQLGDAALACRRRTVRLQFLRYNRISHTQEHCVCVIRKRRSNRLLSWFLAVMMLFSGAVSASSSAIHPHEVDTAVGDLRSALGDICGVNKAVDGDMPDQQGQPHCSLGLCCSIPGLAHAPAIDLGPSWWDDELFRPWFLDRTAPFPNGRVISVAWARGPPLLA
jgi:hypothetical protein